METLKAPEEIPPEEPPKDEPIPRHRDTDPAPPPDSEPPWGSGPDVIVEDEDGW